MNWYWPENSKIISYLLNIVSKRIWFKLANANRHDIWYSKGWTENDRIRCDTWFLRYLLIDSDWVFYKKLLAYIFYFAVRLFWAKHFNYNSKW